MLNLSVHRPLLISKPAVRFGERVWTYENEPLFVSMDKKQYQVLSQQIEASGKRVETAIQQGFQNLIAAMRQSKLTTP